MKRDDEAQNEFVIRLIQEDATTKLRSVLADLLAHVDRNTCEHEDTYRGGSIWTICGDCGRKWADDEGGFQPHQDAPAVAAARRLLSGIDGKA